VGQCATVARLSYCSTVLNQLLPLTLSLWAPPTEAAMAHTPVDTKTGVDRAMALIEEVKAMLAKMMAVEEAKRAALPAAVPPSPIWMPFAPHHPPFHPPCQAIFKWRCLTSLGRRKLASTIHGWLAGEVSVAAPLLGSLSPSPWASPPQPRLAVAQFS
jgi:hypothetical protein